MVVGGAVLKAGRSIGECTSGEATIQVQDTGSLALTTQCVYTKTNAAIEAARAIACMTCDLSQFRLVLSPCHHPNSEDT